MYILFSWLGIHLNSAALNRHWIDIWSVFCPILPNCGTIVEKISTFFRDWKFLRIISNIFQKMLNILDTSLKSQRNPNSGFSWCEVISVPGFLERLAEVGGYPVEFYPMSQYPFESGGANHCHVAVWILLHGVSTSDEDFLHLRSYCQSARRQTVGKCRHVRTLLTKWEKQFFLMETESWGSSRAILNPVLQNATVQHKDFKIFQPGSAGIREHLAYWTFLPTHGHQILHLNVPQAEVLSEQC
jgi:hypothetical protein